MSALVSSWLVIRSSRNKNAFFCDRCWEQTTHMKTVYFQKLPKVLVMRLDRFGKEHKDSRHNLTPVSFDHEKLELYDYCYLAKSEQTKYTLYAIIEHQGLVTGNNFQ